MSQRIKCQTLFNITQTGVLNRSRPQESLGDDWLHMRNTQCNFDTILQVISLRSQPEVVKLPYVTEGDVNKFGLVYQSSKLKVHPIWVFEFEVQHSSVFENGKESLGLLYADCQDVPMLVLSDQTCLMSNFLDASAKLKNIHFEVL